MRKCLCGSIFYLTSNLDVWPICIWISPNTTFKRCAAKTHNIADNLCEMLRIIIITRVVCVSTILSCSTVLDMCHKLYDHAIHNISISNKNKYSALIWDDTLALVIIITKHLHCTNVYMLTGAVPTCPRIQLHTHIWDIVLYLHNSDSSKTCSTNAHISRYTRQ